MFVRSNPTLYTLVAFCIFGIVPNSMRAQGDLASSVLPPPIAATVSSSSMPVDGVDVADGSLGAEQNASSTLGGSKNTGVEFENGIAPSDKILSDPNVLLTEGKVSIAQAPKWYHFAYWFGPTPWDIGFELGINGAEGINEAISFRTGGHLKRETDYWKLDNTLVYNKNSANGVETQNNALLDVRVDRKLGDSRWSLFFLNQELYDEFQAYDLRVSGNAGVGYQLIDTEHIDLIGRFGAGASREFGGPDDSTAFEALFGLEYDHELTKSQRLSAKIDYFPEWEDFERYRVVTDVGWEVDLDKPGNLSLKFSVIDRYDSTPNGADPNEFNYAVLLIWGI